MNILIIGGGAAGMAAALTASECPEYHVVLAERQARTGRKLLSTGNGRCNLTNRVLTAENYHGQQPDFCRPALALFPPEETLAWFASMGLLTVTEPGGRVYPFSDSANSVADVLRLHLEQRENVTIETGCEITQLRRSKGVFYAQAGERTLSADRVIVCAGGAAGAKLGGTELGYRLLGGFGHKRTKLAPSLVQLRTEQGFVRALKGVRCQARVRDERRELLGEVQFTDYGVSGPAIFALSRDFSAEGCRTLTLDFLPQLDTAALAALLQRRQTALPGLPASELLTGMLHNRLGRMLLREAGVAPEQPCGSVTQLARLCEVLKNYRLEVTGTMGLEQAQVTAGGIRTAEFDPETLESRLCPGLYAAGEVLDIDGDCGGYNLQWAWASGRLAGQIRSSR